LSVYRKDQTDRAKNAPVELYSDANADLILNSRTTLFHQNEASVCTVTKCYASPDVLKEVVEGHGELPEDWHRGRMGIGSGLVYREVIPIDGTLIHRKDQRQNLKNIPFTQKSTAFCTRFSIVTTKPLRERTFRGRGRPS